MGSGLCYTVDSGGVVPTAAEMLTSVQVEGPCFGFTDYDHLSEELFVLDLTKQAFASQLGYSASAVYSWKYRGVPKFIRVYMELRLAYEDKVTPEKGVRLA